MSVRSRCGTLSNAAKAPGSLFDRDQSVVLLEGDARVIVGGMTPSLQNGGVPGESTKFRVHRGRPS